MNKVLRISMTLLFITSLMGCGTNKKEEVVEKDTTVDDTTEAPVNPDSTVNNNGNTEHKLELADDVATKILELDEVESANVIVTDNNAYVAAMLKEGVSGDEQTENKIAEQARATNVDFKNVYVSLNPDFVKQMDEYGNKIRENEPVEGFFQEFSDTVKRVFPDAH